VSSNGSLTTDGAAYGEPSEDERRVLTSPSEADREAALRDPGPSWKEWLYAQAFPWWLGIVFLILDSWIAAGWVEVGGWLPLGASLVVAIYLEYLVYQYFWHPYDPERRGKFHRTWHHPFEVGRWSPDRERVLRGDRGPAAGPDPRDFL